MNKKRTIISIIVLSLIVFIFITKPQTVTLKLGVFVGSNWGVPSGESHKIIDTAIEIFEKDNPGIRVVYESGIQKDDYSSWLSNKILKGDEPDVFMVLGDDFNTLSSLGVLMNLDKLIVKDQSFDTSEYYKSSLESGYYQGHQYTLPYESNPQLMFINKTLLKTEGIVLPERQLTLDEFYSICDTITKDLSQDGKLDQFGCYNYSWLDSVYSHGATLFNSEGTKSYFSQNIVKESIEFLQKLDSLNQGHVITSQEFDKGLVAFSPMTFAEYNTYKPYPYRIKKYTTFEWDCIEMPSLTLSEGSEVSSLMIGISNKTKYKNESWNLLKTLTYNPDIQLMIFQYSQGISPLKQVTESSEAFEYINKESSEDSQINMGLLNNVLNNAVNHDQFKKYESALLLAGTKVNDLIKSSNDIDIALINLQKEINIYLNE